MSAPDGSRGAQAPAKGAQESRRSRLVLATLLLVSMLTIMAGATISPSLPGMQEQFSGTNNADLLVRLVLTVPALSIAVCAPVAGSLVDRLGRKPVLLASVALYGLAGGSGLFLGNLYAILAGRALLGVAVAGVMTAATTLIADYYSGRRRGQVLGLQGAFMQFGGVAFLTLGGVLAGVSWRGPFAIYVFALALAPLAFVALAEPPRRGTQTADEGGATKPGSLKDLSPVVVLPYALALLGMVVFYLIPTQLPFYLQSLFGVGPTGSGLVQALNALFAALAALGYGRIRQRLDFGTIAAATFVLYAAGYGLIGLAGSFWVVLLGISLGGVAVGLLVPNLNNWVSSLAPEASRGRALSGVTSLTFLGQFLSPLVAQPVIGTVGLGAAYALAGALALAVALLIVLAARVTGPAGAERRKTRKKGKA